MPSIPVFVLAAALAQAAPAAPSSAQTPATATLAEAYALFLQGQSLEDTGNVDAAVAAYRRALELVPRAAEIHAELSAVYARANRASDAISSAQAALAIDPDNRQAHRILGLVQASLSERTSDPANQRSMRAQAIDHLERALAGTRDPAAEIAISRVYLAAGQHQKAADRLQLFLLDRPDYLEAIVMLASAYDELGRPGDAASEMAKVVAAQPEQLQARLWLAQYAEKAGRWKDAATAWGELATRLPRGTALYRARQASALINAGDFDAGRQLLREITQESPQDLGSWYLLAQVERQAGNAAGAEEAARKVLALDPSDARGPLALAGAQSARGDHRAAAATLEPRVTSPSQADLASGIYGRLAAEYADALEKGGDRARALSALESALARDSSSEAIRFGLVGLYERSRQFDRAERLLRDVIATEPANAGALNYLGYLLADRSEKLPEAVDLIQRALAVEADNPSFLDSLGWAYFKMSRFDAARDPLERAAAALPRNSVIQDHLGDLYVQLRLYRDAVAAFDRALAGDRDSIDVPAVTRKRDRARELAGR
jgi:tetratricopeptide (TPR) repeat protein